MRGHKYKNCYKYKNVTYYVRLPLESFIYFFMKQGLKLRTKSSRKFLARCKNLVAKSSAALCCQRFSEAKYKPGILMCKETAENGEGLKNGVVHVTLQLNYATIRLSSD